MKDIIAAVIFIVSVFGGTIAIRQAHYMVRKAALEKAAHGLPALPSFKESGP